eukprot:7649763-Pyramimonas_sp.AAC.1
MRMRGIRAMGMGGEEGEGEVNDQRRDWEGRQGKRVVTVGGVVIPNWNGLGRLPNPSARRSTFEAYTYGDPSSAVPVRAPMGSPYVQALFVEYCSISDTCKHCLWTISILFGVPQALKGPQTLRGIVVVVM